MKANTTIKSQTLEQIINSDAIHLCTVANPIEEFLHGISTRNYDVSTHLPYAILFDDGTKQFGFCVIDEPIVDPQHNQSHFGYTLKKEGKLDVLAYAMRDSFSDKKVVTVEFPTFCVVNITEHRQCAMSSYRVTFVPLMDGVEFGDIAA